MTVPLAVTLAAMVAVPLAVTLAVTLAAMVAVPLTVLLAVTVAATVHPWPVLATWLWPVKVTVVVRFRVVLMQPLGVPRRS